MSTKLAAASAAKAVVERKEPATAMVTSGDAIDFSADAGMGLEGADKDSFAIPFLAVLQGLSPQLKTVEGARPGKIINTVTNEVSDAVTVVPVAFQRRYNRWLPRSAGGGFKGTMTVADVEAAIAKGDAKYVKNDKGGESLMFDGTELKDTRNHFVLVVDDEGGWKPALMSMASTQIKRSKRWLALIQGLQVSGPGGKKINPPSFASKYLVSTESESNAQGEWESFVIEKGETVNDRALYAAAKDFHAQVSSGAVVAAPPVEGLDPEGDESSTGKF